MPEARFGGLLAFIGLGAARPRKTVERVLMAQMAFCVRVCVARLCLPIVALMMAGLAGPPAVASAASLSWSAPRQLDRPSFPFTALYGLACPSVSQCTAVDAAGRQVTFNPGAPGTPMNHDRPQ